jgi:NADPH2:quinone reductase
MAGIVYALGAKAAKTCEFKIGDRVAAFHPMMAPHGSFADFAVAPNHSVLKLPEGIGFEGTWFLREILFSE